MCSVGRASRSSSSPAGSRRSDGRLERRRGPNPTPPRGEPSYGLFWHLNAGTFYLSYIESDRMDSRLLPGTPPDAYANFGNSGQIIVAIPSLDLVWVRTGRHIPSNIWAPDSTVAQLSAAVVAAVARCALGSGPLEARTLARLDSEPHRATRGTSFLRPYAAHANDDRRPH